MRAGSALVIALVLGLAPVAVAQAPRVGEEPVLSPDTVGVDYQRARQTLVLRLPVGAVPTLLEKDAPPRLVIDIVAPEASITPRSLAYADGLVARYDLTRTQRGGRVVLTMRRPLNGRYRVAFETERMVVVLTVPQPPATPRPSPAVGPTPFRPSPTPVPGVLPAPGSPRSGDYGPLVLAPSWVPLPAASWSPLPRPSWTPAPVWTPVPEPSWTPGMPTPRPRATPRPTTAPTSPVPSEAPAMATPEPTAEPTPRPIPSIPLEPLPSVAPPPEQPVGAVFGSTFSGGLELPLTLSEVYPRGGLDGSVAMVPGAAYNWDLLLAPNYGTSIRARALSYTFEDLEARQDAGVSVQHRRDDYEADFGVFGRLELPFGFEATARPGIKLRRVFGSATAQRKPGQDATPLVATDYLSTGWTGLGPSLGAGLGWRLLGPLVLTGGGEVGYLYGGTMDARSVASVLPMLGWRAGGEARLELGSVGLALGYSLGHWGHDSTVPTEVLTQDWGGPTARLIWLY